MRAAAEDLDLRQRNEGRAVAGKDMAPERHLAARRRGVERRERNGDDGVAAEPRQGLRPVEPNERLIDAGLIERIGADERGRDLGANSLERVLHVEAAEARAAVALLDRLMGSARGAGRSHAAPDGAVAEQNFRFDRRAAARIPDAAGAKRLECGIAHVVRAPGFGDLGEPRRRGRDQRRPPQRRTASRSLSRVRYSTGDLPSILARNKAGSSAAARPSTSPASSQSTPAR